VVIGNTVHVPGTEGGGISNNGTLLVRDSGVDGNTAPARGGGIYNGETGTAILTGCTVIGNSAATGPGVFNDGGAMIVRDCTIQP